MTRQFCHIRRSNDDWVPVYEKCLFTYKLSSVFIHIYKVKQKETRPASQSGFGSKRIGHLVELCVGGSQATQIQAK